MRHAEIRDAVAKVDAQLLFDLEGGLLDSLAEALPPPEELKASCFFCRGFSKELEELGLRPLLFQANETVSGVGREAWEF